MLKKYSSEIDTFLKLCDKATNFDQLHGRVKHYLEGGKVVINGGMKKFIRDFYYKVDGKSTERCAAEIDRFVRENKIKTRRAVPFDLIGNMLTHDFRTFARNLLYSSGKIRNAYLKRRWKMPDEAIEFMGKEPPFASF